MKVEFRSGVVDKLDSTCRFLRHAGEAGTPVTVCADAATLERLGLRLWGAEPQSFVPHLRLKPGQQAAPAVLARTLIRLVERTEAGAVSGVLLNLGPQMAEHWDRYERVVEIVSNAADDVAAGRRRWREYAQCAGAEMVHEPGQAAQ